MCGFWKAAPAVCSVKRDVDLIGGLAKFSFRALRLPGTREKNDAGVNNLHGGDSGHL